MKKRYIAWILLGMLTLTSCGAKPAAQTDLSSAEEETIFAEVTETLAETNNTEELPYQKYAAMSAAEITAALTLEQKAAQMVQPAIYEVDVEEMQKYDYGSILSKNESVSFGEWQEIVDGFQEAAVASASGIPYLYGQDDVHGVNYCLDSVIFPHNIGMGAANDPELLYQVGLATADEAKLCHMLWNFAPCVAQSVDLRWGRTYESYGSDLGTIRTLSTAYTKGLLDGGLVACAKHFFGDGNVVFGTGEQSDYPRLIDRGDASLSEEEIDELLSVYQSLIDAGVQTIMVSHSSLNGTKMHENAEYIQKLKQEMGFDGFIVSDWNSVQNTSPSTYREQVITAVNAGIDMLMEVSDYEEAMGIIVDAVDSGAISEERVNDAAERIIRVKLEEGLFADPFCEQMQTVQQSTGSEEYRQLAETLVEESLVLLKNENSVLPIQKGTSVYITGPAADNPQAQCGGWTIDWNSSPKKEIRGVTTILEGFRQRAEAFGITVITDKNKAAEADVVILAVGETSYAEWYGDTENPSLYGDLGLPANEKAIAEVRELGKPVVTCIVAGRNVFLNAEDYDSWDGVVMCYLPGSEGQGIADVLCGESDFHGTLPSPWYSSADQIGTESCWLERGYGMTYQAAAE